MIIGEGKDFIIRVMTEKPIRRIRSNGRLRVLKVVLGSPIAVY